MGNQYTKPTSATVIPITARCPQRNRNITSVKNEQQRPLKDRTNNNMTSSSRNERNSKNIIVSREKLDTNSSAESKKTLPTQTCNSSIKTIESSSEKNIKIRKKKVKMNLNNDLPKEIESPKCSQEFNEIKKRQPFQLEKSNISKPPSQTEVKLISDIFNTVAELESTFIDEKKYERRLRTAFSNQIENMQHLELSLHVEKERNKRLMELMNRYDNTELCAESNKCLSPISTECPQKGIELNDLLSNSDRSKWSYEHTFSNSTESISPILMQQRYNELSRSYNTCQAELRRKDKLLTLAHCKQEALQAKCDRLTEQNLASQRKIETLQHKISMLYKKIAQIKISTDLCDSDESLEDVCQICHGTIKESTSRCRSEDDENVEELPNEKKEDRLDELEKFISIGSEKSLPKAKSE